MGEYAHAMGNGLGNFDQFWALARTYPQIQGGFIWDWAEQNLRQPLVITPDSSPNRIQAFLVGKPGQEAGHRGQAVALSSLDDFVDVFRDPRLDVAGTALTLDAWVKPGTWTGSFPIVTKGQQYALQMRDDRTARVRCRHRGAGTRWRPAVPADWYGAWHRVTGVYDGGALRLYVDGRRGRGGAADRRAASRDCSRSTSAATPRRSRRTTETPPRARPGRRRPGLRPRAHRRPTVRRCRPAGAAVLALDFDRYTRSGDFLSLGLSLSGTDGLVGSDRYVQPETVEMAWAQAPIRFTPVDAAAGKVRVRNEQQAGAFDAELRWSLVEVDRTMRLGQPPAAPRAGPVRRSRRRAGSRRTPVTWSGGSTCRR